MSVNKEVKRVTTNILQEMKSAAKKSLCLPLMIILWLL